MIKIFRLFIFLLLAGNVAVAQTDTTAFAYQKPLFDFDYTKPVFKLEAEQANNNNRFLRSIVLTGYRAGVKPIAGSFGMNWEIYDDPSAGTRRVAAYNLSIVEMLNHVPITDPEHVILEVQDPSKYMYRPEYGDKESWMRKNAICYEYTMPGNFIAKQIGNGPYAPMLWDAELRNLLGITVRREKRTISPENQEAEVLIITEIKK